MKVSTPINPHASVLVKIFQIPKSEIEEFSNQITDSIQRELERSMVELTPRDQRILRARFGFGVPAKTHKQLAEEFDVSVYRIGGILKKVFRKFNHPSRKDRLVIALADADVSFPDSEVLIEDVTTPMVYRPIEYLGLNEISCKSLHRGGVGLVGDLIKKTELDLLRFPSMGIRNFMHIEEVLSKHGLRLSD